MKNFFFKRSILLVVVVLLFVIAAINFIKKKKFNNELRYQRSFVTGMVVKGQLRPKSGKSLDVYFTFVVNGKTFRSESLVNGIYLKDFNNNFLNRSFPVIFSPKNIEKNEILITPDKFKRFNLLFPDSLRWVLKYWEQDYYELD